MMPLCCFFPINHVSYWCQLIDVWAGHDQPWIAMPLREILLSLSRTESCRKMPQALEPLTCARKDTMAEDAGGLDLWCFLMDVVRYPISNVVWIIRKELYTYRSHLESLVPNVLGTFQSARNLGHWKMFPFKSRISTGIRGTLRVFTAFLHVIFGTVCRACCTKKMKCIFWCKIDLQSRAHQNGLPGQSNSLKQYRQLRFSRHIVQPPSSSNGQEKLFETTCIFRGSIYDVNQSSHHYYDSYHYHVLSLSITIVTVSILKLSTILLRWLKDA